VALTELERNDWLMVYGRELIEVGRRNKNKIDRTIVLCEKHKGKVSGSVQVSCTWKMGIG